MFFHLMSSHPTSYERMFGNTRSHDVVHVTSEKYRETVARVAENSINPGGRNDALPLSARPSTWLRGRGRDHVALPRQRDLEGIRNRGSVLKRGLTQSQYADSLIHRAVLHRGCYNTETSRSRPANLDQNPTFEFPESVPLSVIHAFFYKYIVLSA